MSGRLDECVYCKTPTVSAAGIYLHIFEVHLSLNADGSDATLMESVVEP